MLKKSVFLILTVFLFQSFNSCVNCDPGPKEEYNVSIIEANLEFYDNQSISKKLLRLELLNDTELISSLESRILNSMKIQTMMACSPAPPTYNYINPVSSIEVFLEQGSFSENITDELVVLSSDGTEIGSIEENLALCIEMSFSESQSYFFGYSSNEKQIREELEYKVVVTLADGQTLEGEL